MPLQLSEFTDPPLLFIILEPCHYNFKILRNMPLHTPSSCFSKFMDQNITAFFFLSSPPSFLSLNGKSRGRLGARAQAATATAVAEPAPEQAGTGSSRSLSLPHPTSPTPTPLLSLSVLYVHPSISFKPPRPRTPSLTGIHSSSGGGRAFRRRHAAQPSASAD